MFKIKSNEKNNEEEKEQENQITNFHLDYNPFNNKIESKINLRKIISNEKELMEMCDIDQQTLDNIKKIRKQFFIIKINTKSYSKTKRRWRKKSRDNKYDNRIYNSKKQRKNFDRRQ